MFFLALLHGARAACASITANFENVQAHSTTPKPLKGNDLPLPSVFPSIFSCSLHLFALLASLPFWFLLVLCSCFIVDSLDQLSLLSFCSLRTRGVLKISFLSLLHLLHFLSLISLPFCPFLRLSFSPSLSGRWHLTLLPKTGRPKADRREPKETEGNYHMVAILGRNLVTLPVRRWKC